jgi:predicted transposase YbfD/YdcC
MICGARAVLAQRDVNAKTNEITHVKPLLDDVDITGALVTADALHVQKETARYLAEDKGADYLFTAVKDNQPGLFAALDAPDWEHAPIAHAARDRGHGRDETRTLQVLPVPGALFPHTAQAFLIERTVLDRTAASCARLSPRSVSPAGAPSAAARPRSSRPQRAATGTSRPCTTTPLCARTRNVCVPAHPPGSWPPSATPPSPSCGSPASPLPPRDDAGPHVIQPGRSRPSVSYYENDQSPGPSYTCGHSARQCHDRYHHLSIDGRLGWTGENRGR